MNTLPDQFQRRAQWQNNAINHADAYLLAAEMPSYSDVVTLLADMLDTSRTATETSELLTKARETVDRACGAGKPGPIWAQMFGRTHRPIGVRTAVLDIFPDAKFENVGVAHGRVIVPAEHVEPVREAVESARIAGQIVEVEAEPQ